MAFEILDISHNKSSVPKDIINLWHECFGDTEEYIIDFCKLMPIVSFVCGYCDGILVSLTVLIRPSKGYCGYYGYAVCTTSAYRGRGYAAQIHKYIENKCGSSGYDYFLHPATRELESFYQRLGMQASSSFYEVKTISYDGIKTRRIEESEYSFIRDTYFGGSFYCPWDSSALSFMKREGVDFLYAEIDGVDCAAAVDGDMILELCAPEYLFGKASSAFLPDSGRLGTVRFISEPNHADSAAVMSLSGKPMYFNLFLD